MHRYYFRLALDTAACDDEPKVTIGSKFFTATDFIMKIGIDAYPLFADKNTGIGIYVITMLESLSREHSDDEFYLYTPAVTHKETAKLISKNKKFHIVEVHGFFKKSRRVWLQSPQILSHIKRNQIDVFWGGGEYIPILLPKHVTAVTTIHDVVFKLFPETVSAANAFFYRTLFRLCLKRADRCLTVSNTSKKEINALLGFPEDRIDVIYNAIDTELFSKEKKNEKKKHVLFVGTLQPRKNLINVLRAYTAAADYIDEPLIVVGSSGWKNSALREYIDCIPVDTRDRIEFKGYVGQDELVSLYREAFCVVCPSLHEGFGLCIGEGMAAGSVVIASKRGAVEEVFGDAPVYVDPESPHDIASAIIRVITKKNVRAAYERAGIACVKKYDISNLGKKYITYFNSLRPENKDAAPAKKAGKKKK
jgi:glycosyltransferase involved in cell wall biosynthesis